MNTLVIFAVALLAALAAAEPGYVSSSSHHGLVQAHPSYYGHATSYANQYQVTAPRYGYYGYPAAAHSTYHGAYRSYAPYTTYAHRAYPAYGAYGYGHRAYGLHY